MENKLVVVRGYVICFLVLLDTVRNIDIHHVSLYVMYHHNSFCTEWYFGCASSLHFSVIPRNESASSKAICTNSPVRKVTIKPVSDLHLLPHSPLPVPIPIPPNTLQVCTASVEICFEKRSQCASMAAWSDLSFVHRGFTTWFSNTGMTRQHSCNTGHCRGNRSSSCNGDQDGF